MKRDMDLIRALLLKVEEETESPWEALSYPTGANFGLDGYTPEQTYHHFHLLMEDGLVRAEEVPGEFIVERLTVKGHDFVDKVRDPEVWQKTREGAKKVGGFSLKLFGDLAEGLLKKKIKDHTGIDI